MATFFGEVLSVHSRAVEQDDEEEEELEEDQEIYREMEEKREVQLSWSSAVSPGLSAGEKLRCSQLLLAVGANAARFLSLHVLSSSDWEEVARASLWNERGRASASGEESACVFYQQRALPTVLVCQVSCFVAEDQLFQWTEKVFQCLELQGLEVTVLSDASVAEYKTALYQSAGSAPFLRCLHTRAFPGAPACSSLEPPNILTGLPAAVLNHCEVHAVPAVVYQCYSDVMGPDSVTMETYRPALSRLARSIQMDPSPSTDVLRKFVTTSSIQSNLYI